MANELVINANILYEDSEGSSAALSVLNYIASVASKKYIKHKQAIGIADEAVILGEVTSPGWAIFWNKDATNFVSLKVAAGGAIFAKLLPGEFAFLRLGSGAQAPYAIANIASVNIEFLIAST